MSIDAAGLKSPDAMEVFRLHDLPLDIGATCVGFLCNVATCQLLHTSKKFQEFALLALSRCRPRVVLPHRRSLSGHELFKSVVSLSPRPERVVQTSLAGSGHTEVVFLQDTYVNVFEVTLETLLQSPCPSHLTSLSLSAKQGLRPLIDAIPCPGKVFPKLRRLSLDVSDIRHRDADDGRTSHGLSSTLLHEFARLWAPLNLDHFKFRTAFHYTPLIPELTVAFGALPFLKELHFNLCQPVERISNPATLRNALISLANALPTKHERVHVRIGGEERNVWLDIFNDMNNMMLCRFPNCVMTQKLTRYSGLVIFCN